MKFLYSLGLNKVNFDVQAVIKGTKLQNKQEQTPSLFKTAKTDSGWELVYILPPGIVLKEFEDRRDYFQSYTNSIVDFELHGRRLTMYIHQKTFPTHIDFEYFKREEVIPLLIGVTPNEEWIYSDLTKLPHMLVGGETGYGKTTALICFVTTFILCGVDVSVIDRKRVDFPPFEPWIKISTGESESQSMLENEVIDMEKRLDKLNKSGKQKIQQHKGMRYKVVIVDELAEVRSKKSQECIERLSRMGRAAGIHLILATQKPSMNVWKGFTDTRSMLPGRLCFYVVDSNDSQIILGKGNSRGKDLPMIPGRAIWNNDKNIMVQCPFLSAEDAIKLLPEVKKDEQKDEQQIIRLPTR